MAIRFTDLVEGMKQRRAALLPAILIVIVAGGIFIFFDIAHEMAEGELRHIDHRIFLLFRNPADISDPLGPDWLSEAALEVTAIGGYPLITLTVGIVTGLLLVLKRYGPALYTVLSIGTGALLSQALKGYYDRPRPDIVKHLDVVHTASFPSGHALITTLAYLTLAALVIRFVDDWRARVYVVAVAVFIALIVGLSRIYLGVHWPTDVAAGWAIGAAWAGLTWLAVSALQFYRGKQRGEDDGR